MMIKYPGRLPGLNEIIAAAKQGKGKYQPYAIMKDRYTSEIGWLAKKLPRYSRVDITITWYEPNRRRDPDNVSGGQKFYWTGWCGAGQLGMTVNGISTVLHTGLRWIGKIRELKLILRRQTNA